MRERYAYAYGIKFIIEMQDKTTNQTKKKKALNEIYKREQSIKHKATTIQESNSEQN